LEGSQHYAEDEELLKNDYMDYETFMNLARNLRLKEKLEIRDWETFTSLKYGGKTPAHILPAVEVVLSIAATNVNDPGYQKPAIRV
jgi:hypothetical protein